MMVPGRLLACATCFGQSDEAMAKGMNMGILALLICIVGVLVGVAGIGFFLVRRAARMTPTSSNEAAGQLRLAVEQISK